MKSVTIPNGVRVIEDMVFSETDSLETVIMSDSVEEIGEKAFEWSSVKNIKFGKGIKKIGSEAFCEVHNIESIIIPESVAFLGKNTFLRSSISEIIFEGLNGWSAGEKEITPEELKDFETVISLLRENDLICKSE